jgi:8-oxo-dGTP diphosphatase
MLTSSRDRGHGFAGSSDARAKAHFVLALLLVKGRYVMQLRDDKPGISEPGVWALFGGSVEEGESPDAALIREVGEELGIQLSDCRLLGTFEHYNEFAAVRAQYWLFEADITHLWGQHRLMEGQAVELFTFVELQELCMPPLIREVLARHQSVRVPMYRP